MIVFMDYRRFLISYFPVFICGFFTMLLSVESTSYLIAGQLYRKEQEGYLFLVDCLLALTVVHCNFMLLRGRPHWVWCAVGLLVICLLSAVPAAFYRADPFIWFLTMISPLLGLFILNSRRHRKFRRKMVQVRRHREQVRKALKIVKARESGRFRSGR